MKNGVYVVSEGANMPTQFRKAWKSFIQKQRFSTARVRQLTPVAYLGFPVWKCRRTACAYGWSREEVDNKLYIAS